MFSDPLTIATEGLLPPPDSLARALYFIKSIINSGTNNKLIALFAVLFDDDEL